MAVFTDLQTVAVNVDLSHSTAPHVDILDLLWGDVLALCQLEDVLLPIDDLQRPILPNAHARVHTLTDPSALQTITSGPLFLSNRA